MHVEQFFEGLRAWQGLVGSLFGSGVTIFVAIWITRKFTTATKRTDFFLDFTKRYHTIRAQAHGLDNVINTKRLSLPTYEPNDLEKGDAHQVYFQIFGLVYDEFYAYERNFLERKIFVDWMTWQMCDAAENNTIGGVHYANGWETWSAIPAIKIQSATSFMNEIRKCLKLKGSDRCTEEYVRRVETCVRRAAILFGPSRARRILAKVTACFRAA